MVPELRPVAVGRFAGVLDFSKAPLPTRILLRFLSIATWVGEGDYRDWKAIRAWAQELLSSKNLKSRVSRPR